MRNFVFIILSFFLFYSCNNRDDIGHVFIKVKGGTFALGSDSTETNFTHTITIADFEIAETETTNEQFELFVNATGYVTDAEKKGYAKVFRENLPEWEWELCKGACWKYPFGPNNDGAENKRNHPVTQISAADAKAYCEWLGARLPTLDEWEVAGRAGVKTLYPWGNSLKINDKYLANTWQGKDHKDNLKEDGFLFTSPIKSFPPNKIGLYDIIGNVFEYCSNEIKEIDENDTTIYTTGRGGSWWCSTNSCNYLNLLERGQMPFHESICNQGFRVAK